MLKTISVIATLLMLTMMVMMMMMTTMRLSTFLPSVKKLLVLILCSSNKTCAASLHLRAYNRATCPSPCWQPVSGGLASAHEPCAPIELLPRVRLITIKWTLPAKHPEWGGTETKVIVGLGSPTCRNIPDPKVTSSNPQHPTRPWNNKPKTLKL